MKIFKDYIWQTSSFAGLLLLGCVLMPRLEDSGRSQIAFSTIEVKVDRGAQKSRERRDANSRFDHTSFSVEWLEEVLERQDLFGLLSRSAEIADLIDRYPHFGEEIMVLYAKQLMKHDPGSVLERLRDTEPKYLAQEVGIKLSKMWHLAEPESFQNHLSILIDQGREGEARSILDLFMTIRNEKPDIMKMLDVVQYDLSKSYLLEGHALNAILNQVFFGGVMSSEEESALFEMYQRNAEKNEFQPFLSKFVSKVIEDQPSRARDFIAQLPLSSQREMLMSNLIKEVTYSRPEEVADWLASEDILNQLLPHKESSAEWEESFDLLLSLYIEELVKQYPDDALANLNSFFDSDFKNRFGKKIEDMAEKTSKIQGMHLQ